MIKFYPVWLGCEVSVLAGNRPAGPPVDTRSFIGSGTILGPRNIVIKELVNSALPGPCSGTGVQRAAEERLTTPWRERRDESRVVEESQSVHFSPQTRLVALNRSHLSVVVVCSERDEGANGGASCLIAQC
ncbi:hypothetical protein WN48_07842 [Eufriesea mexicana]|uniref:Uncharacterized protein n=1 Tax=Eufriesea mexicana TaxID=516756 RepID=A0A310SC02_9HYME|nr:hypothetical protein WN48_07842 [Eufriesea mexicana]